MTEEQSERKKSRGILATIIVIIIMLVLVGLILPVFGHRFENLRNDASCGRTQSQMMGALVYYQSVYDGSYPISTHLKLGKGMTAHEARQMSYYLLGTIAREHSIPFKLLSCPLSSRPNYKLVSFEGSHPPPEWGMTDGPAFFAIDWAAPFEPAAARVILADRDPTAHVDSIMACFGDAHVKKLKYASGSVRKSGALVTEGCDGQPVLINAFSELGDDIYSADGDSGDPLTPGAGDPLRAWVK